MEGRRPVLSRIIYGIGWALLLAITITLASATNTLELPLPAVAQKPYPSTPYDRPTPSIASMPRAPPRSPPLPSPNPPPVPLPSLNRIIPSPQPSNPPSPQPWHPRFPPPHFPLPLPLRPPTSAPLSPTWSNPSLNPITTHHHPPGFPLGSSPTRSPSSHPTLPLSPYQPHQPAGQLGMSLREQTAPSRRSPPSFPLWSPLPRSPPALPLASLGNQLSLPGLLTQTEINTVLPQPLDPESLSPVSPSSLGTISRLQSNSQALEGQVPPPPPRQLADRIEVVGRASLIGPAVNCHGRAGGGDGAIDTWGVVSTGPNGELSGTGIMTGSYMIVSLTPASRSSHCTDAFTGLPLPYTISAPTSSTAANGPGVLITPVTSLLQYGSAASTAALAAAGISALQAGYGMFGINASERDAGAIAALRRMDPESRRTGVRMLFADAAVSSLVFIAQAALAAFPTGTLPGCTTSDARFAAVQTILVTRTLPAATTLDVTSTSLLPAVLKGAALNVCGAAPSILTEDDIVAIFSQASFLYGSTVASALALSDTTKLAQLTALPMAALSTAARVLYVVQTLSPAVLEALVWNPDAVLQLVADWSIHLEGAPVNLKAMVAALDDLSTPPDTDRVRIRVLAGGGPLVHCQVDVRNVYLANSTRVFTDDSGSGRAEGIAAAMVSVPSGCKDSALSVNGTDVRSPLPLQVLIPLGSDSAAINAVGTLATAMYLASANTATAAPRYISVADFVAVYRYFGVGDVDNNSNNSTSTNSNSNSSSGGNSSDSELMGFVSLMWTSGSGTLPTRVYLVNARLTAALTPICTFLQGLLNTATRSTADQVAASVISLLGNDLLDGTLRLEDPDYLSDLMHRAYGIQLARPGNRRRLHQLSPASPLPAGDARLDELFSTVAAITAESTAMLASVDRQLQAAPATASVNTPDVVRRVTQLASVQLTALVPALRQLVAFVSLPAKAVGEGDPQAAQMSMTAALRGSFSGEALQALADGATVNTSAAMYGIGSVQNPAAGSGGGAHGRAVAIGVGIGASIAGAAVLAAFAFTVRLARRRNAFTFDLRDSFPSVRQFIAYSFSFMSAAARQDDSSMLSEPTGRRQHCDRNKQDPGRCGGSLSAPASFSSNEHHQASLMMPPRGSQSSLAAHGQQQVHQQHMPQAQNLQNDSRRTEPKDLDTDERSTFPECGVQVEAVVVSNEHSKDMVGLRLKQDADWDKTEHLQASSPAGSTSVQVIYSVTRRQDSNPSSKGKVNSDRTTSAAAVAETTTSMAAGTDPAALRTPEIAAADTIALGAVLVRGLGAARPVNSRVMHLRSSSALAMNSSEGAESSPGSQSPGLGSPSDGSEGGAPEEYPRGGARRGQLLPIPPTMLLASSSISPPSVLRPNTLSRRQSPS